MPKTSSCDCTTDGNKKCPQPIIYIVPKTTIKVSSKDVKASAPKFFDKDYIKKNFKLPPKSSYMDPDNRPLICYPMTQEGGNFNLARKTKLNQQILDGILDPSEAIMAPDLSQSSLKDEEEEEITYILQLPDHTYEEGGKTIRVPRFIWHTCVKDSSKKRGPAVKAIMKKGPGKRPKPWILSRHTDFDLLSQW